MDVSWHFFCLLLPTALLHAHGKQPLFFSRPSTWLKNPRSGCDEGRNLPPSPGCGMEDALYSQPHIGLMSIGPLCPSAALRIVKWPTYLPGALRTVNSVDSTCRSKIVCLFVTEPDPNSASRGLHVMMPGTALPWLTAPPGSSASPASHSPESPSPITVSRNPLQ